MRSLLINRDSFLFLPIVYRLAGRMADLDWQTLGDDPQRWAVAQASAQAHFRLPATVAHFRVGIEAESCGADLDRDGEGEWSEQGPGRRGDPSLLTAEALGRPPLSLALQATRLLADELAARGASTIGVLTGPRALASLFEGQPAAPDRFFGELAAAYAKQGAGALLVVEDGSPIVEEDPAIFEPLVVTARYYRLPLLLLDAAVKEPPHGFDLVIDPTRMLPLEELEAPPEDPGHWRAHHAPLLMTEWEVPPELDPARLESWLTALNGTGPEEAR